MKRKLMIFFFLIIFIAFIIYGIIKGDLNYIKGFGIFLCLDCIGIS